MDPRCDIPIHVADGLVEKESRTSHEDRCATAALRRRIRGACCEKEAAMCRSHSCASNLRRIYILKLSDF